MAPDYSGLRDLQTKIITPPNSNFLPLEQAQLIFVRTCNICLIIESGARSLMFPTNTVVTGGFSSFFSICLNNITSYDIFIMSDMKFSVKAFTLYCQAAMFSCFTDVDI